MLSRRLMLLSSAALAALAPFRLRAADITKPAADFVTALAERVIAILKNASLSREARVNALSDAFRDGFDVNTIGQFALGRYWRLASEAERKEYLDVFRHYVVQTYAVRFNSYAGESFVVTKSAPDGENGAMVHSDIGTPGEEPARVQWRVRQESGGLKIVDVIVEGVSLLVTQRAEFASVLQRNGGKVPLLSAMLRDKIVELQKVS